MRTPRPLDLTGTLVLLASGGAWLLYRRSGSALWLTAFFALCAFGIGLEHLWERGRRRARRSHPSTRQAG